MTKPYLFYYEEAVDAWIPVPDNIENIVAAENLDPGEDVEIRFKRVDLTQWQYDNLPDGD